MLDPSKHNCILVAAARAFARFGFKKASVDGIAKEAGVAKGTIYLAASSKQELFYQVLHQEVCSWVAHTSRQVLPTLPPPAALEQSLRADYQYAAETPLVHGLLVGEAERVMPKLSEGVRQLKTLGRSNVERVLKQGLLTGQFQAQSQPDELAECFHHWLSSQLLLAGQPGASKALELGLGLMIRGLRPHS